MHAAVTGEASRLATRSPEEALAELRERERTLTILRQTRARLDGRARRVVRLRHDWDLEWKKIASILDVSQATVRRDYAAAVRRLGRKMRVVGVTRPSWD
jgi:DNA-directed RNA polymerase specialized sigma subunit